MFVDTYFESFSRQLFAVFSISKNMLIFVNELLTIVPYGGEEIVKKFTL